MVITCVGFGDVWSFCFMALLSGVTPALGSMPPGRAIAWLPTIGAGGGTPSARAAGVTSSSVVLSEGVVGAVPQLAMESNSNSLAPVPEKFAKKITNLEFVGMKDLLPDSWGEEEETGKNVWTLPKRKSAPISILQWVQCYCRLVGALATKYPGMVPKLMAYAIVIVKCARDFEGSA